MMTEEDLVFLGECLRDAELADLWRAGLVTLAWAEDGNLLVYRRGTVRGPLEIHRLVPA